ncbi:multicopper oxidase-domain-containing protein [Colletotrichum navitas]|uniref:Multicopper oxidase-domain-containing protein n=1 Tax=Colletotrichum navitas TaxID=681940 RepID=A0AAD8PP66_9PEZI|nr:multicopper oxidase-domain-containing protein [Colletotrichum navitas]KAK1573184.1 multicopper oxidase-domain-containing protein [Colletotrichum navitas]
MYNQALIVFPILAADLPPRKHQAKILALRHIWVIIIDAAQFLFGSPSFGDVAQCRFGGRPSLLHIDTLTKHGHPIFTRLGSNIVKFVCNYTLTTGFKSCSTPDNRSCWLRDPDTGEEYNINTDYETNIPQGITRIYHLNVTDGDINANGLDSNGAKLFNDLWPGPLIEACWRDEVGIHVHNKLAYNGTSIHWHGIRQNQTMHMDGINGITQCPIAPQSHFVYKWNATQYGSSWYHSHYSVQYADGLQAPIEIHGPTSFPYDEAIEPITVTDWANNSAFENIHPGRKPDREDILLGGLGNIVRFTGGKTANTTEIPRGYEVWFDNIKPNPATRAKRYLLRLINTSFDTTFVFSIDNHNFTVIEADFVPVKPFNATSSLIAIGQRCHVIVEATPVVNSSYPSANPLPDDGNYWIRTWVADRCGVILKYIGDKENYMKTCILRYEYTSTVEPSTTAWEVSPDCSDTAINNQIVPVVPWTVGDGAYGQIAVLLADGLDRAP